MKLPKRIVKLLFWGLIPLLILALAGQGNAAQQYQYYDLGALGGPESQAYGINASGWVVGVRANRLRGLARLLKDAH